MKRRRTVLMRQQVLVRALDLLVETAGGQLIGIEIKAAATVTVSDARHLAWLRDETGDGGRGVRDRAQTGAIFLDISERGAVEPHENAVVR